jgi:two-component system NtrC family sensor kinase
LRISTKIVLTMFMFVILVGAIGLLAFNNLDEVGTKLGFLEEADKLTNSILELRRTEKNYFLYHDPNSLAEARDYLDEAQTALSRLAGHKGAQLSPAGIKAVRDALGNYRQALDELQRRESRQTADRIRWAGRDLLELSSQMAHEEQRRVEFLIHFSKQAMLISFSVLFALGLLGAYFVGQRIVRPLSEIERTTRRISSGEFSVVPGPFAHDETGSLMRAFNTMVERLQERTEQLVQARKMAALGTLTAGVAHELNNPLNNIYITAEMLVDDFQDLPEGKKLSLIQDVAGQADRAKDIVRNLLEFAREREPSREPCQLRGIVEASLRFVAHQAELANVDIESELPPPLVTVEADPKQLQQVFINLFLNAIEAMPGGGSLEVGTEVQPDKQYILVTVADTGPGIPAEVLPHIFDPFFSTKELGTGLGLAVSYGIIKKHGGGIEVQSAPGKGTTFTVTLPVRAEAAHAAA